MVKKLPWKKLTIEHLLIGIITFLFLVILFPVRVPCGVPSYTCASAPNSEGVYTVSFDVEPLFAMMIEKRTGKDFPYKYFVGNWKKGTNITPMIKQSHGNHTKNNYTRKANISVITRGRSFFNDNLRIAYSKYVTSSGQTSWKETSPKLIIMVKGRPELTRVVTPTPSLEVSIGDYTVTVIEASPYEVAVKVLATSITQEAITSRETAAGSDLGGYCEEYGNCYTDELSHFFNDHLRIGLSKKTDGDGEPSLQLWIGVKDNPELTKTLDGKAPKRIMVGIFRIDVVSANSSVANFRIIRTDADCLRKQKK